MFNCTGCAFALKFGLVIDLMKVITIFLLEFFKEKNLYETNNCLQK